MAERRKAWMTRGARVGGQRGPRHRRGHLAHPAARRGRSRPFVFNPETRIRERLPEGPELRNPASMAEYTALERARTLDAQNCTDR